nr:Gag-Pol polyprotein [Tanacetum cinerariifolium]
MASLADKAILSGADNRPPMLEKDMYDSWNSRMELYMLNQPHGRMILESVEQGKRKPRKGQNRIKTEQKREAFRSREKFKAVAVERRRKTEENKKRMAENAYTYQKLCKLKEKKKREGQYVQFFQSSTTRTKIANCSNLCARDEL